MRRERSIVRRRIGGFSARTRGTIIAAAMMVVVAGVGSTSVALGADSPQAAVEALVERISSGGFDDLEGLVCPENQDAVRSQFDPGASMGAPGAVQVLIGDVSVSLVSEAADSATVKVTGTARMEVDEERAREAVRAQLEASGEDSSDAAVEAMLGFLMAFDGQDFPVDEDLAVVRRDGQWLVCDDLGEGGSGDGTTSSTDGMCGLVSLEELEAISPVSFDSSVGEGDSCQWIAASDTEYASLDVQLSRDMTLDEFRAFYPEAEELPVAGHQAIASNGELFVEVDQGVLYVLPYLDDSPRAAAVDPLTYSVQVAELFLPRLGDLPIGADTIETGGTSDAGGAGAGGGLGGPLADCGAITLDGLAALGPLRYDSVTGSGGSCVYSSTDPAEGFHFLSITLDPLSTMDMYKTAYAGGTETEVDGRPAYSAMDLLMVQLDEGVLIVAPFFTGSPGAEGLDPATYAADVARFVIGVIATSG